MKLITEEVEKDLLEKFHQMQKVAFDNPILKSEDIQKEIATRKFSKLLSFTNQFSISVILTLSPENDNSVYFWAASLAYVQNNSRKPKSRLLWMKKETRLAKEILQLMLRDVGLVDEEIGDSNPVTFYGYKLTLQAHKNLSDFEKSILKCGEN